MKPALRFWLFVLLAAAVVFFTLDRAEAQRNIGRPPGTITGRPPGGGISGMPKPGTALGGGGISGMPKPGSALGGNSNIGGAPGGNFGGGIGGLGGAPILEKVWTCGKCGRELGRGTFRPTTTCACGLNYVNGTARDNAPGFLGGNGAGGGMGGPPPGAITQPGGMGGIAQPPPIVIGNQPGNAFIGQNQPGNNPGNAFIGQPPVNQPPTMGNNVPTEVNNAAKSVTGGMIAAGITAILFGLAILGSVVFLVINNGKEYAGPSRRRSRD